MPNAISRFKPNQTLKVEKENENNDIRRKLRSIQRGRVPTGTNFTATPVGKLTTNLNLHRLEKLLNPKSESVWERLSKVKKCPSNEGSIGSSVRSRHNLHAKSSNRLPTLRNAGGPPSSSKRPLAPNTTQNKRPERKALRKSKTTKAVFMPDPDSDGIPFTCQPPQTVKELLTARSICNSKSSSEDSKKYEKKLTSPKVHPTFYGGPPDGYDVGDLELGNLNFNSFSQDSFEDYEMAPLMPVPTRDSLDFSAKIANNFRNLLEQKQHSMDPDEIKVIKNVVKTDERHRQLQKNDSELFKDILKTQLQEILRQESVVKAALSKLEPAEESEDDEEEETVNMVDVTPRILEERAVTTEQEVDTTPQVDVIFKNVPSLEKEIVILKALGEKLEATLRRTASMRSLSAREQKTTATSTSTMRIAKPVIVERVKCVSMMKQESCVQVMIQPKGLLFYKGLAKEFRIAQKTIVELKEEAHRHFYLPVNNEKTDLRRTSFKKLKSNPDVLLRHLKPKNSLVPFNVLEQDPIFFNSFIFSTTGYTKVDSSVFPEVTLQEEGSEDSDRIVFVQDGGDSSLRSIITGLNTLKASKDPLKMEDIRQFYDNMETCQHIIPPHPPMPQLSIEEKVCGEYQAMSHASDHELLYPVPNLEPEQDEALLERGRDRVKGGIRDTNKSIQTGDEVLAKDIQEALHHQNKASAIAAEIQDYGRNTERNANQAKQRRRIRRSLTPMPIDKCAEPKNTLLKTILVGTVQISVFILLIMAITYPEAKC